MMFQEEKPKNPKTITILQWNILFTVPFEKTLTYLKTINADILCLQEVTSDSSFNPGVNIPDQLAQALSMKYYYEPCRYLKAGRWFIRDGNGIFSKFPILLKQSQILSQEGFEFALERKVLRKYVEAEIAISDNQTLTVATTHLSWFFPTRSHIQMREKEAVRLGEIVATKRERFVITGDFNASPGFSSVKNVSAFLRASELDYRKPTWVLKHFEKLGIRRRLDYAFTTQDLRVIRTEILPPGPSDHCPVLVKIAC